MACNQLSDATELWRSLTLTAVMRPVPALEPTASVSRALDLLRYGGIDTVPVADESGAFVGVVTGRELISLLNSRNDPGALAGPVSGYVRRPASIGRAEMSVEEVGQLLATCSETTLAIVDDRNRYLGVVGLTDLLRPMQVLPRPPMIGGMATPWGVYLTNGSLQAGAGNLALAGAGAVLGSLIALAYVSVGVGSWALQKVFGWPLFMIWNGADPARLTLANCGWFLLHALSLLLFLLLVRSIPLAKYHAAEHQAVHAMERGESLSVEVVRRMPRVHPRCGTNLMAAGLVFGLVTLAVGSLQISWLDPTDGLLVGALAALFTWRSVGAWLQEHFTTAIASDRHLLNGIRAAENLEEMYLLSPPGVPSISRRIWCSGMVQTAAGAGTASLFSKYLIDWAFHYLR